MFFKKNKADSVDAEENKRKEIELSGDIKERYAKSGYQEKKSLTNEEVYLLFCDKKDWPAYDPKTGEDNVERFIRVLKWLETNHFNYIVFPDILKPKKWSILEGRPVFSNCIFQGTFNINSEAVKYEFFHFVNCIFFDTFEIIGIDNVILSGCSYKGDKYNDNIIKAKSRICIEEASFLGFLQITSMRNVTISKTNIGIVEISCEELSISDSEFNKVLFCKTGRINNDESVLFRSKPIITVLKKSVFNQFKFYTEDSKIGSMSIDECFIDIFEPNSSKTKLGYLYIDFSIIEKINIFDITCSYISLQETEVNKFLKLKTKQGVYINNFILKSQKNDSNIYTDGNISFRNSDMSGCELSIEASSVKSYKSKIKNLSATAYNPDDAIKIERSELEKLEISCGKLTVEQCNIKSLIDRGKSSITLFLTKSNIKKIYIYKLRSVYIGHTKMDHISITGIDKDSSVEINKSEIQKFSSIRHAKTRIDDSIFNEEVLIYDAEVRIDHSTINNKLNIRLEHDSPDKDIVLVGNDIDSLNVSQCRINGKITLWYNTIKEQFSLYKTRARQLEIENTTVSGKCDLRYLDIDRLCILKSCHFSNLLDLSFSYIAYLAFHSSNLRKLNMDCLFYKDIKVFDTKGLDTEGVQQELAEDNFATKESCRLFKQLPNVTTVTTESDEES